jgi:hypothetical protein
VAATVALVLGGLHLLLRPRTGTDIAAQIARASFAGAHPATPVDLSWYGGVHPYGYSLLAPYVLHVVGIGLTGLLAAVAAAVLLARLLRDSAHPVAGAALGAFFCVANVVSGRTTFALGAVAGLAALALLPRRGPAALAAALSGLLSPVAAAFLGLAAAVLVLRRLPGGWTTGLAASGPVALLAWLFPSGGVQPYEAGSAPYAVLAGLVLAALTHSPLLRTGGLLYATAAGLLVLLSDPFGSNVLRLGLLLAAPLVVATATERWRLVAPVTAALLLWQVQPLWADLRASRPPSFVALNRALLDPRRPPGRVVPAARPRRGRPYVAPVVPLARGGRARSTPTATACSTGGRSRPVTTRRGCARTASTRWRSVRRRGRTAAARPSGPCCSSAASPGSSRSGRTASGGSGGSPAPSRSPAPRCRCWTPTARPSACGRTGPRRSS